ncbi:hypothetical protein AN642_02920 [Epulopiscium sp. SCG-B10WGA-EpuloA2]|nr:hypothetical protein AN642_02920 [Epulopiscium sp. SCG-B10WGA-EpuloA2]
MTTAKTSLTNAISTFTTAVKQGTALKDAIDEAGRIIDSYQVANDPSTLDLGITYITTEQNTALTDAKAAADNKKAANTPVADQEAALVALQDAFDK